MRAVYPLLLIAAIAHAGRTAPEWLRNAEIYNGWYKRWTDEAIQEMRGIPLVIGVPPDKALIEKAHGQGLRVLVYVTFYQMPPNQEYQKADIAEHPDWIRITPEGTDGPSCFNASDNRGWLATCPNSPDYRRYVLEYTRWVMDQGADGLFIDNAHPEKTCDGPKFERHQHLYPDEDNHSAYRRLLGDVRAAVKGYGEDRVTIANAGNPNRLWVGACDGQMFESYICTHAADHRWHSEERLLAFAREWGPISEQGDRLVTLSYLGHTANTPREDGYYCYAWARISGFLWADWFTGQDVIRDLYQLRLGPATGPMETGEGYYLRRFERGLVVLSGESRSPSIRLSAEDHPLLFDLFSATRVGPGPSGDYELTLGPGQGRVYLFREAAD